MFPPYPTPEAPDPRRDPPETGPLASRRNPERGLVVGTVGREGETGRQWGRVGPGGTATQCGDDPGKPRAVRRPRDLVSLPSKCKGGPSRPFGSPPPLSTGPGNSRSDNLTLTLPGLRDRHRGRPHFRTSVLRPCTPLRGPPHPPPAPSTAVRSETYGPPHVPSPNCSGSPVGVLLETGSHWGKTGRPVV